MMFASSLASNLLIPALPIRIPQQGGPGVLSHVPPSMQHCQPCCGKGSLLPFSLFKDIILILVPRRLLEKGTSPFLSAELPFAQFRFYHWWCRGGSKVPSQPFPSPLVLLTFGSSSVRDSQANIDLCCPHSAHPGGLVQSSPSALGGMELLQLIRSSHYSCANGMVGHSEPKSLLAQTPVLGTLVFQGHNSVAVWEFP